MSFKETRVQDIPCLSFMIDTPYNLYVGPKLSWFERRKLRKVKDMYNIIYLPDLFAVLPGNTKMSAR